MYLRVDGGEREQGIDRRYRATAVGTEGHHGILAEPTGHGPVGVERSGKKLANKEATQKRRRNVLSRRLRRTSSAGSKSTRDMVRRVG